MTLDVLRQQLTQARQGRILAWFDQLNEPERTKLAGQLGALDLPLIQTLIETHVRSKPLVPLPHDIQPVKAYPRKPTPQLSALYDRAQSRGGELLRQGKVAAFVVAGGQGTRLG